MREFIVPTLAEREPFHENAGMRILHTSDLHLGHTLAQQSRAAEQRYMLDSLVRIVHDRRVEAVLISGDLYDSATPPIAARRLYFDFLRALADTGCRTLIVTGGNHDSPSLLEVTRGLMAAIPTMHIHQIGAVEGHSPEELVIPLTDADDQVAAIVVAVPHLRLRDASPAGYAAGTDAAARIAAYISGVRNVYTSLTETAFRMREKLAETSDAATPPGRPIPILAMGHFHAGGGVIGESEREPIGNLDAIPVDVFPPTIARVLLGHLHRRQTLTDAAGHTDRIQYCGTPIPLDFSEADRRRGVLLYETGGGNRDSAENAMADDVEFVEIPPPPFRRLLNLRGTLTQVGEQLDRFAAASPEFVSRPESSATPFFGSVASPKMAIRGTTSDDDGNFGDERPEAWLQVLLNGSEFVVDPVGEVERLLKDRGLAERVQPLVVRLEASDIAAFHGDGDVRNDDDKSDDGSATPARSLRDFSPRVVFESLLDQRIPRPATPDNSVENSTECDQVAESSEHDTLRRDLLDDFDLMLREFRESDSSPNPGTV